MIDDFVFLVTNTLFISLLVNIFIIVPLVIYFIFFVIQN